MAVLRKNDSWWIDYYYQGKRHRQKVGTRKKDAEEALNQIKVKIATGEYVPPEERQCQEQQGPQVVLFKEFAYAEFLPWSKGQHAKSHYERQEKALRLHLIPFFKGLYLHGITAQRVEAYKLKRSRSRFTRGKTTKPVNKATINRELSCLKMVFRKAVEWGYLEASPARDVRIYRETPKAPRLLERGEVARLLAELPEHLQALVACAVYAGLRRAELFYLRWEDISWKTGQVAVVSRQEHHTKNYETRRIPMNDALQTALRRHPRRLGSPYVFCNAEGKPYDNVKRALNSAAKRAGIQGGVQLHQLRHAFCSHALMQGVDPRTVQKWMGHKDLKTTLKYAHVSPDHEKAAIQRLSYGDGHYMDTKAGSA